MSADLEFVAAAGDETLAVPAPASMFARAWAIVEAHIGKIEENLAGGGQPPIERERDARILALLSRTLKELTAAEAPARGSALRTSDEHDDDPVPADLDDLRRRLAQKIDELAAADAVAVPGETER